jgi:hypothetical protein
MSTAHIRPIAAVSAEDSSCFRWFNALNSRNIANVNRNLGSPSPILLPPEQKGERSSDVMACQLGKQFCTTNAIRISGLPRSSHLGCARSCDNSYINRPDEPIGSPPVLPESRLGSY